MSNYNLKAKRKSDGEILEFSAIDVGFEYKYYENIKTTKPNPNGDVRLPAYLTSKEFNELYEIVEEVEYKDKNLVVFDYSGLEDRFNAEFVREDGLLNIDKYDHERIINFIKKELQ